MQAIAAVPALDTCANKHGNGSACAATFVLTLGGAVILVVGGHGNVIGGHRGAEAGALVVVGAVLLSGVGWKKESSASGMSDPGHEGERGLFVQRGGDNAKNHKEEGGGYYAG